MELHELKSELINTRNSFSVYPNDFEANALATNISWSIVEQTGGIEAYFNNLERKYRMGNYLVRIYGPNGRGRIEKKNGVVTVSSMPVSQMNGLDRLPVYEARPIHTGAVDQYTKDRIEDLKSTIRDLKDEMSLLKTENKSLSKENQDLKLETQTAETKKQYEIQQIMSNHKSSLAGIGSELVGLLKASPELLPAILGAIRGTGAPATAALPSGPQYNDTVKFMLDQTAEVYQAAGDEKCVQLFAALTALAGNDDLLAYVTQQMSGMGNIQQEQNTSVTASTTRRTKMHV